LDFGLNEKSMATAESGGNRAIPKRAAASEGGRQQEQAQKRWKRCNMPDDC